MSLSELLSDLGDSVRSGDKIRSVVTARRMNAIIGAIKALARGENIIGGPGVRVKTASSSGVVLIGNPRTQAGEGYIPPFTCSATAGSETEGSKLYVTPGFVNNQIPTINGVPLDHDPAPAINLSKGVNYIYLKTQGSYNPATGDETIERTTIECYSEEKEDPDPTATAWTAYGELCRVTVASGVVSTPLSRFQTSLHVGNFGTVNMYYA